MESRKLAFGQSVTRRAASSNIPPGKTEVTDASQIMGPALEVSRGQKRILSETAEARISSLPEASIRTSRIETMSAEDIIKMSVCQVSNPGDSGQNTLNDPRMGTFDHLTLCQTCHLTSIDCPGHFGYIKLATYVYHPMLMEEVIKVLRSVCEDCSRILLTDEEIRAMNLTRIAPHTRLTEIARASEGKACRRTQWTDEEIKMKFANQMNRTNATVDDIRRQYNLYNKRCNRNPKYINKKDIKQIQFKRAAGDDPQVLDIHRIYEEIFNAIPREDLKVLGFAGTAHPRNFIMSVLVVTPPYSRAPRLVNGNYEMDKVTEMYRRIIKTNLIIENTKTKPEDRLENINRLSRDIYQLIVGGSGDTRFRSFKIQIQGKKGLIRIAMMGVRGNYTARTVLGPNPSLRFGQISVPRIFAPYLTRQEVIVNNEEFSNIDHFKNLLRQGKIRSIIHGPQRTTYGRVEEIFPNSRFKAQLLVGDTVERHLQDGDMIIFNRQPTLHKKSMLGYEVVLWDEYTIGLSLPSVSHHNAD